jgi:uncharacterized protein YodC (DUF2158 family)
VYDRFTDRLWKVLQLANLEATRWASDHVDPEHLLLGLLAKGSGPATNVLKNLDVDLRKIRLEVEKRLVRGPNTFLGELPQSPATKAVIEETISAARGMKFSYVGTEHLLLGLLSVESRARGVLVALRISFDAVVEEIRNITGHNEKAAMEEPAPAEANAPAHDEPSTFRPGDVVCLRSGGSPLTVVDVGVHSGVVICACRPDEATRLACIGPELLVQAQLVMDAQTGETTWQIQIPLVEPAKPSGGTTRLSNFQAIGDRT